MLPCTSNQRTLTGVKLSRGQRKQALTKSSLIPSLPDSSLPEGSTLVNTYIFHLCNSYFFF